MAYAGGKGPRDPGAHPEDQQPPEAAHHQAGGDHREGSQNGRSGQGKEDPKKYFTRQTLTKLFITFSYHDHTDYKGQYIP